MLSLKRKRSLIRIISFTATAFVVTLGFAVTEFLTANSLRMNIEYSYQRSLSDLSDHVNNINIALQKAQYAGTMPQLVGLASQIRMESAAAKTSLSQISVTDVNFANTTRFLSQVGDYANSLSQSLTVNQKLSAKDRNTITALSTSSQKLSLQLDDFVADVQSGSLALFKPDKAPSDLEAPEVQAVSAVQSGFQSIEDNMSGLPTMIYDGPFSDNVLKKMPELTQGKPAISRESARAIAANFLGVDPGVVGDDGETDGNLPTYNFTKGSKSIDISKNGGYVVRMLDSRLVTQTKLNPDTATKKANDFLRSHKLDNMTQTYYLTNNNICVMNCAYMQGDVTCYTDLMKVGVALDNGEIVSFDATGYIMNHKSRNLPTPKITQKAAHSMLSPALTVKKQSLALIPTGGTSEALCYEFKCSASGGKNVIDYFNVVTGVEEQLLILIQTPGGTLAM